MTLKNMPTSIYRQFNFVFMIISQSVTILTIATYPVSMFVIKSYSKTKKLYCFDLENPFFDILQIWIPFIKRNLSSEVIFLFV